MERTYELVKRFGIDIDVYVAKDSDTIIWKLPDNVLNKDFLRLYFMGQIEKVWMDCWYDMYYALTKKGEKIYLPVTHITAYDIEKIIKDKRGGKRPGAGPKSKMGGFDTVTIRIPFLLKENIRCFIDMFSHYCNAEPNSLSYFTSEEERLATICKMKSVLEYEERLICERRKRAAEEEENKRQLKLFGDETNECS